MPRKNKMARAANGAGTIRKKTVTKNGREYIYYEGRCTTGFDPETGRQIQKSVTGKTQREVQQRLSEMAVEVAKGDFRSPSKMTLKDWLETWEAEYTADVKASTALLYKENLDKYVIPYLGNVKLKNLTSLMIQHLYNRLLQDKESGGLGLSAKSVRNVHGVLHKALQQAVDLGNLRVNPTDACKLPKAVKKEKYPLDEAHTTAFLKAVQGHTHEYLYKIVLFTGLREGEVLGLTWDCVDFEHGTLLVKQQLCHERRKGGTTYLSPTKNSKSRCLTLAPSVVRLFRLQKLKQNGQRLEAGDLWEENNLVFSNSVGGFLSYRTVYDCFKRIVKQIGSPKTSFHDLRHTYTVLALKSGDDVKTTQENLGHATPEFTLNVYAHVTHQMKKDSADRMEQMIQSVSAG